jgi:hypothetical protein
MGQHSIDSVVEFKVFKTVTMKTTVFIIITDSAVGIATGYRLDD